MDNSQTQTVNFWNRISLGLFFAGLAAGGLLLAGNTWEYLAYGILTFSGLCLFGLLAAVISLVKKEKTPFLTWFGFILNGAVILLALFFIVG